MESTDVRAWLKMCSVSDMFKKKELLITVKNQKHVSLTLYVGLDSFKAIQEFWMIKPLSF